MTDRQQAKRCAVGRQLFGLIERNIESLAARIVFFFGDAGAHHVFDREGNLLGMSIASKHHVPAVGDSEAIVVAAHDYGDAARPGRRAQFVGQMRPGILRRFVDHDGFDGQVGNGGIGGVGRIGADRPQTQAVQRLAQVLHPAVVPAEQQQAGIHTHSRALPKPDDSYSGHWIAVLQGKSKQTRHGALLTWNAQ